MSRTVSTDVGDSTCCASSERSTTSTEEFEHEPFSTFKTKVTQLCEKSWPHISPGAFEVTHMEGGSYNRVMGIHFDMSHKRTSWLQHHATRLLQIFWPRSANVQKKIQEYVIRILRYEHAQRRAPAEVAMHSAPMDVYTFVKDQLARQRKYDLSLHRRYINPWSKFNRIIDYKDYYLTHMDFEPRNILIHSISNSTAYLSGILDWDESVFAPAFLSCRAPSWLWDFEGDDDEELDESIAHVDPQDAELLAVKQAFESAVGAKWLVYAYKTEYRLARDIVHLAITGINSSEGYDVANRIFEEWNELRPAQVVNRIVPGEED